MSMQLVVFTIDGEEYGFDIAAVNGILRAKKFALKKMPGTSQAIAGMINVRGRVNYILDLRAKFALAPKGLAEETKFIMFHSGQANIGCIADEITDIVKLDDASIQPAPPFMNKNCAQFVKSLGKLDKRIIIILDPGFILASEERSKIESAI